MIKRIARRVLNIIRPPKEVSSAAPVLNAEYGEELAIDSSVVAVTFGEGKIIFSGKNYIGREVELGGAGLITIGKGTTIQSRCIILGDVEIGKYCTFAPNIYISSGRHYYNYKPELYVRDQDEMVQKDPVLSARHSRKVTIGDDCWIGINSVIMSGVTIGRGAVIGANSVVTKDVSPFTVVVGSPAAFVKNRLEFYAKDQLDPHSDNDLPNFYKGFVCDYKTLQSDRSSGGIGAGASFTCYMKSAGKSTIAIRLKKMVQESVFLEYGQQQFEITGPGFQDVKFPIGDVDYHEFRTVAKQVNLDKTEKVYLVESLTTF